MIGGIMKPVQKDPTGQSLHRLAVVTNCPAGQKLLASTHSDAAAFGTRPSAQAANVSFPPGHSEAAGHGRHTPESRYMPGAQLSSARGQLVAPGAAGRYGHGMKDELPPRQTAPAGHG